MTSQKTQRIRVLAAIGIAILVGLVLGTIFTSCSSKHIGILNDIKTYEQTLDPEFCANLVDRIDLFNDECEPEIEILDCG